MEFKASHYAPPPLGCVEGPTTLDGLVKQFRAIDDRCQSLAQELTQAADRITGFRPELMPAGAALSAAPDGLLSELEEVHRLISRSLDKISDSSGRLNRSIA